MSIFHEETPIQVREELSVGAYRLWRRELGWSTFLWATAGSYALANAIDRGAVFSWVAFAAAAFNFAFGVWRLFRPAETLASEALEVRRLRDRAWKREAFEALDSTRGNASSKRKGA
ncbi:hypothetical protein [Patulibacter minatonensis]|uniref:hypothetical protein n=1 Tax=Patulibacter minatonensis TaxID=298163 RepID=UPI00047DE9E4|nr:hypothetical protein [Patulibacter minatonensis]